MILDDLNFLKSEAGREILQRYGSYSDEDLYRLLFKSADSDAGKFLPGAVTLIKLRRQAKLKFKLADQMFFTPLNLEQSTSEAISEHIAARFKADWKVADLTCGLGGNLIPLAVRCQKAVAVDKLDLNIICAQENARAYSVADKIEFIIGDAYENLPADADAFFLDPARDREGKSKTRSILNSEPELLKILPEIFKITHNVGVKISPAFDYKELDDLPEIPEIEIISEDNNCKVAMLWFGELKSGAARRATILAKGNIYGYASSEKRPSIPIKEKPGAYLYEPNKAIIKAHLIEEAASIYGLAKINRHLSFLTGEALVGTDKPGVLRAFKVNACLPFNLRELKARLKSENIKRLNIMTKRFLLKPEELYKKLKIKEGGNIFLIATVLSDEERYYILAERV